MISRCRMNTPISLQQVVSFSLCRRTSLLTGEGGKGLGGGAKSYDREKVCPSIKHSIVNTLCYQHFLQGLDWSVLRPVLSDPLPLLLGELLAVAVGAGALLYPALRADAPVRLLLRAHTINVIRKSPN